MTPEDWERITAADQGSTSFLQQPPPQLTKQTRLGEFEIESLLGEGGMGQVYRARDRRLGRTVAIKVLPPFAASDPQRLRRFEQEAQAAGALNHPNILAVYQMGTHEGAPYLVTELLEGETLREQLGHGPLPVRKAIDEAVQIAHGLAAAHDKGIVHRDLKPENLFVTRDGRVKILDFGLAKLLGPPATVAGQSLPTVSATAPGIVMGTVGYMAPEQVRGEPADHRTDLFALGVILYEMLTGRRAFHEPTHVETMTAVLNREPPAVSDLEPGLAPGLVRVVQRCLEKHPEQRFQSASDLAFALESLSDSQPVAAGRRTDFPRRRAVRLGGVLLIAGVAIIGWLWTRRAPALTDRDVVVVADWVNTTGDPVFDDALKPALAVDLEQSPFLSILSAERVRTALRFMGRSADERIPPPIARDLCQREGIKAMLAPSIAAIGTHYSIALEASSCATGETLARDEVEAVGKEAVIARLDDAVSAIRRKLGESLATIRKFDVPIAEATTSSLDALKALNQGDLQRLRGNDTGAIPFYRHAVEADPDFALGYARLGVELRNNSEYGAALEAERRAFELRQRTSEPERLYIASAYHGWVTFDLEQRRDVGRLPKRP